MKSSGYLYLFIILILTQSFTGIGVKPNNRIYHLPKGLSSKDYLPNTVIIKYKNMPPSGIKTFDTGDKKNPSTIKIKYQRAVLRFGDVSLKSYADQQKIDKAGLNRIFEVGYDNNLSVENAINEILKDDRVEYAEPSFVYHTFVDPNDPFFPVAQNYLTQVKAQEAWNVQPNANGTVIAIVDSGSDLTHEDLSDNIFINTNDPVNGIDDDNDGYIDNNKGWDFVGLTANNIIEDNDPGAKSDSVDHGIHVSGLASAVTNNGKGIASIAQTAKLMILKVGSDDNARAIYRGYDGIVYAVDHGVKIISCSWGGPGGGAFGQDVINYAVSKGCLVVVAAGNDGTADPEYPAAYKGVFAVANVKDNDVKAPSSSFGYNVSISAPGTNIYSTVNRSMYGYKTGTSMATPIVSSAVALVMAKFPTLTAIQAGEILRLNADDIYGISGNGPYIDQLGKGRLNVFKAVSSSNTSPSIKNQKITINSNSSGSYTPGDTLSYYFDLKDILQNTDNILVGLSSSSQNVKILTASLNLGPINTDQTKTIGPFKVVVQANTLDNTPVVFKLSYNNASVSYQDQEYFTTTVNLDYQNITVNKVYSTSTSIGKVGFSGDDATNGLGFIYKDSDLLYEASLMIGNSPTKVSNNARALSGAYDHHFQKVARITKVTNTNADYDANAIFNDFGNSSLIGVNVKNRMTAYKSAPDDKYIIAEYEVTNLNTSAISNVYIGLFTDWDINGGSKNLLRYDDGLKLAYCYASTSNSYYAGVKLLSANALPAFYPMSYQIPGDFQEDGNFTTAEKFSTLSSGIKSNTLGTGDGIDIMFTSGYGPYNLAPNQSVKVAFAFLAGDNLADLKNSAVAAQTKYGQLTTATNPNVLLNQFSVSQNYPNPISSKGSFNVYLPSNGKLNIEIYDLAGKKINTLFNNDLKKGTHNFTLDANKLNTGIYFYRASFEGLEKVMKMVVVK
ncbi:S8 family peptidase [Pedobacter sp. SD-b]|uniref:S8 family peptidase n=1 Tax=Pedobacter segetis TaxID=2793069 RepID=A0ABS1BJN1_9SPHI|nr:S8 family serine peptidase [Pedobacter segetis]MBK0382419.1 S8 family peptidase [Pedobacter segetis]